MRVELNHPENHPITHFTPGDVVCGAVNGVTYLVIKPVMHDGELLNIAHLKTGELSSTRGKYRAISGAFVEGAP